jgi:hypothetical protein
MVCLIRIAVLLSFLGLIPARALAEDLDQHLEVSPGGMLQVDLDLGEEMRAGRVSLDVRSHDADEVWAVADLSGLGASSVRFRLEHDNQIVRLYGRAGGLMSWLFGGPGVSVRVWVPREYSLDLRSTAGLIRIEDISGRVRARTSNAPIQVYGAQGSLNLRAQDGAVRVTEMLGDVTVRVSKGDITLDWITGDIEARTGNGEIRLKHVEGRSVLRSDWGEIELLDVRGLTDAKTERGAIHATFAGPPEGLLETRRGSIDVRYPSPTGLQLDALTRSGTVEVGGRTRPNRVPRGKDRFVGALNGGGSLLRIFTARGVIRVNPR